MRKTIASFLLTCLVLSCLCVGSTRLGVARGAQDQEQGNEEWQPPQARDFGDSIWKENRKPTRRQPKRRKYQRVSVAPISTIALKYRKPNAGASDKRRRPATTFKPTLAWQDVALTSSEQIGVTIWRLRKCGGADRQRCFLKLNDAQGRPIMYEAVRITTDADFRVGDGIQLAVESPVKGFIYVIHQEVYKGGRTGEPKLLYPLREGGNVVGPGRPLLIPAQVGEGVKVLKMRNEEGRNLAAERLKIILVKRPIDGLFVENRLRHIGDADVRLWESQWSGRLELFDLEGGDKESMSPNEWFAMQDSNDGGRDLTTEDLAPQKLYVVERNKNDGVLITLDLPYGK